MGHLDRSSFGFDIISAPYSKRIINDYSESVKDCYRPWGGGSSGFPPHPAIFAAFVGHVEIGPVCRRIFDIGDIIAGVYNGRL